MPPPCKRGALILAALVVWTAGLAAQERDTLELTLQDALRRAIENNHDLETARLEMDRADARVNEAIGTALPKIDFGARYTYALKKPVFFLPDFNDLESGRVLPIEIGSDHAVDLSFSASQPLFDAAIFIGVGAAKIYSRGARELYLSKESEIVTATRKAYYGVLLAREVRVLVGQTLDNAQENLATARALYRQGLASEYDQLRAEVGVENIRPELLDAETNYRLALNNLKTVIGLPYDARVGVAGILEFSPVDDSVLAAAQRTVLERNPDIAALRLQSQINDAITSAERSQYLPRLSAFGTYDYVTQANRLRLSEMDFISSSTIGLSLSINIFNGLQTTARVDQAELEYRKSQEQVAGLELTLRTGTEAALLRLETARQRVESQGRTVEQAERGYRIANTRYTTGSGTLLETRDALLALTQARVNRVRAVYDYQIAAAELDQLLGRVPTFTSGHE